MRFSALDTSVEAVEHVRSVAARLAPHLDAGNFRVEAVEAMSFPDEFADVVISNAVLHFARDDAHFEAMVRGMWRVLRPGGMLFCRVASTIGMEYAGASSSNRRAALSDAGRDGVVSGGRGPADAADERVWVGSWWIR